MYAFLVTQIQVMLVTEEIKSLLLGIAPLFEKNLMMTWKSKKQDVMSRSSAKADYRDMAYTACEMVWLKNLLIELGF